MITSASNPRLKLVRRLQSRAQRARTGLFVCEGEDLVEAAVAAGLEPVELLVAGETVAPELLAAVSTLPHSARVIGVFRRADLPGLGESNRLLLGPGLALWHVSDPGNVGGLLLTYSAMRVGKVSIVAPVTSTEGAIAALLAVAAGESVGIGSGVMLGLIACGVVLASTSPAGGSDGHPVRATLFAAGAAFCFGGGLYATGRVSASLPLVWALIPPRALGVVAVALPLIATRRLRITRQAVPFVVGSGLAELGGFTLYAIGSRHGSLMPSSNCG